MNPLLNNGRTDIFWRDINEDDSIFLQENRNRSILILTDARSHPCHPHISNARDVNLSNWDCFHDEAVQFYAFLTP